MSSISAPTSSATDTEPALLELSGVEKRYGRKAVLRGISLVLRRKEQVLIVGPNGSGKSTLLRMLAGATPASRGTSKGSHAFRAMRVCYVPQSGGLYQGLTVAQNMHALARLTGARPPDIPAEHPQVLALDLEPYVDVRAGNLSGGFQKLASIACALAAEPDALFLDEPLAGVDPQGCLKLVEALRSLAERLALLVMTDHVTERLSMGTRLIHLKRGELRVAQ